MFRDDPIGVISLTDIPENEAYRYSIADHSCHIFKKGDDITGTVVITPPAEQTLYHRGITISAVGYCYIGNTSFETLFTVTKEIVPSGDFSDCFRSQFIIPEVDFPFPTYHGQSFSIKYMVIMKILKWVAHYTVTEPIVVIFPETAVPVPKTIMMVSNPLINLSLDLHTTILDKDSCIKGYLTLNRCDIPLSKVVIGLLSREKLKIMNASKVMEKLLVEQSLTDGTPRVGARIRVMMFLKPLKLWPLPKIEKCRIRTKYYLQTIVIDANSNIWTQEIEIRIVRSTP